MFKRTIFLILLAFGMSTLSQIHAEEFISKSGELVSLMLCQMEDLDECCDVFVNAFLLAYEDLTLEQLGVQDKTLFLKDAFGDMYRDVQTGKQKLFVAKHQEKVIGFVSFEEAEKPHQIYIAHLAVDPNYWQEGIGKRLVFSALDAFEGVDRLVVITRKVNEVAKKFYQKLGFVSSSYIHPGYSSEKYIGYEWSK